MSVRKHTGLGNVNIWSGDLASTPDRLYGDIYHYEDIFLDDGKCIQYSNFLKSKYGVA